MDAVLVRNYPKPVLCLDERSVTLKHAQPSWSKMCELWNFVQGFGGMTPGYEALGFVPTLAVDFNEKMLQLYRKHGDCPTLVGDVTCIDTVKQILELYTRGCCHHCRICMPAIFSTWRSEG